MLHSAPATALILVIRRGLSFLGVALLILACSFVVNIALTSTTGTVGYFLLPGRAWEMLAGAMLAWRLRHYGPLIAEGSKLANAVGLLGLLLIALGLWLIDKDKAFPGWWAILPVLGTVLLIAAGERSLTSTFILARKPMVAIGLISFPLYLWHWPLLSFARILHGEAAPAALLGGLLVLSGVLATLSYQFIEKPVRRSLGRRSLLLILGATLLVAVVAGNIYTRDGLSFRLKDSQAAAESRALEWGDEMRASADCRIQLSEESEIGCLIADPQRQADAVIVGDSHANHYYWGLSRVLGEQGANLMQIARGACSPLYGVALLDGAKIVDCNRFIDPVIGHIAQNQAIRTVFLGGRWMAYITGREFKDAPGRISEERLVLAGAPPGLQPSRREVFERGLDETLRRLHAAGKRVIFLHAVPELPFNARECVSWAPNRFVSRVPRETCDVAREQVDARTAEYRNILDGVLQRYPQVIQFDPQLLLCDAQRCVGRADGVLLYRDDDHLSLGGSQWIARRMQPLLREALQRH